MIPLALSGMLGAGLFLGIAPAANAAGPWLLVGVFIAMIAAACSFVAATAHSASYPGQGASYVGTRVGIGVLAGRIAASTHLVGHVAAMAAVAGAVSDYATPGGSPVVATFVIFLVVLISTSGFRGRSAYVWAALAVGVGMVVMIISVSLAVPPVVTAASERPGGDHAEGILGAAGVLFFAFLGFERMLSSSPGRERAATLSFRSTLFPVIAVAVLMLALSAALLYQLGPVRLALSPVPALDVLDAADARTLRPLVGAGVAVAMLPALFTALKSLRSTASAVAGDGDLPKRLVAPGRSGTPVRLDLLVAAGAAGLAWLLEPTMALALASCCLLGHYALVNAGGRLLLRDESVWRVRSTCLGMGLSVVMAMSMPITALVGTFAAVLAGPLIAGVCTRRWH